MLAMQSAERIAWLLDTDPPQVGRQTGTRPASCRRPLGNHRLPGRSARSIRTLQVGQSSSAHCRAIDCRPAGCNVLDLERDDVTTAQLAVDGQVKHRQIARPPLDLEFRADRPNVLRRSGGFWPISLPLLQGSRDCAVVMALSGFSMASSSVNEGRTRMEAPRSSASGAQPPCRASRRVGTGRC